MVCNFVWEYNNLLIPKQNYKIHAFDGIYDSRWESYMVIERPIYLTFLQLKTREFHGFDFLRINDGIFPWPIECSNTVPAL